jgi:micrococcal nuclease
MSAAPVPNHVHYGIVTRWVDGDTLYINGDLDFRIHGDLECRLIGVNTPEKGQINYKEATFEACHLAPVGTQVVFKSEKDPEKWGRWLVELWASDVDVDEALIASGLGVPYFGGKR